MTIPDISSLLQIPALIITYNPLTGFENHLEQLFDEFKQIILVDNGSSPEFQQMLKQQAEQHGAKLELIINHNNLGIATALNQGFDRAIYYGYMFLITLDQDSLPVPGMTKEMLKAYSGYPRQDQIAIVAPKIEDSVAGITARYLRPKHYLFFERKFCVGETLDGVSIAITSGSLHNVEIYKKLGPFRDDFFIDYVDTEYCLRAKKQGYEIIVAGKARLLHRLGNQKKVKIAGMEMRPTFHSAVRWYYISRNRVPMIKLYGFYFPHWLLYEIVVDSYGLLRMLLFEDHKINKLLAVLLGSIDGLFGRLGVISNTRKKLVSKTY